uniref:Uncharacterized protein n=1 Tax=Hordeum vulgare subsp. vulgare TaxID=112509 RepID=A0A8I6WZ37_HORVV
MRQRLDPRVPTLDEEPRSRWMRPTTDKGAGGPSCRARRRIPSSFLLNPQSRLAVQQGSSVGGHGAGERRPWSTTSVRWAVGGGGWAGAMQERQGPQGWWWGWSGKSGGIRQSAASSSPASAPPQIEAGLPGLFAAFSSGWEKTPTTYISERREYQGRASENRDGIPIN